MRQIFVTGGTGYIGRRAIEALLARGHTVRALCREAAVSRLPAGAIPVVGDALSGATFGDAVHAGDTFIQLVGTPHPGPSRAAEFERVDLVSARESVRVAVARGVHHFIYLSVAQPAPIMRAYVDVRRRGEATLATSGLRYTALRPWYVLGPGHRWPWLLLPLYALWERMPSTRDTARRLGLVTLEQMVAAMVRAVEHPPTSLARIVDVPGIRNAASGAPWPDD
ncbi:MAG: NAD(P)H-binding protein [Gemmatimonadaceae bacterium]|nr:NAD(P)H-binding protein [Gemmatimonadaceae bacterium]